jgi:hypothetical protein
MRLLALALLAPLVVLAFGCNSPEVSASTACLDWPNASCPSVAEMPLYFDYQQSGKCGTSLVSVDGPAVVMDKQCCWPVTESYQQCDEELL